MPALSVCKVCAVCDQYALHSGGLYSSCSDKKGLQMMLLGWATLSWVVVTVLVTVENDDAIWCLII